MIQKTFQWFNKPFPQVESTRDIILISLGSGFVVMAILLVLKPFGIKEIDRDLFFYLFGYGLIDIGITAVYFFLPRIMPSWRPSRRWTTGKSLVFIISLLFVIALCNYIYGEYLAGKVYVEGFREIHRGGILSWLFMTVSVGIIPLVFALYFIERRLMNRNQLRADEFNSVIIDAVVSTGPSQISIGTGNDTLEDLIVSDFICIRAEGGNYSTVFWQNGDETKKKLMRLTLVGFMKHAEGIESIVRCHKSYVINMDRVLSFQGNARSVSVRLDGLDFDLPVSRSFPREKISNQG